MESSCTAEFRFYEELNDFLPPQRRKRTIAYTFEGSPGVKDPIEAMGVPHPEVELIVVNGESVGFGYRLRDGDRVAVYPAFEALDVSPLVRLRAAPPRPTAFVVDVNLGKLARRLRMLGFDALYRNDYDDREVVDLSARTGRIILTRDRRLLYPRAVTHGYWLRADDPDRQTVEVIRRFDLGRQVAPFKRCLDCNGVLETVDKAEVADRLEPLTRRYYTEFHRCRECKKLYWKGSHFEHMRATVDRFAAIARRSIRAPRPI
ncbi:MAG: twitching motility protein PilT [Proteobacteria bacterium]|nr:MAG: twitching motility protein PilT [Pseudomonadota bacterium]